MKTEQRRPRRKFYSKYIVHDERRFVYFVVEKVACSSVKSALMPLFDLDVAPYRDKTPRGEPILRIHKMFANSGYQVGKPEILSGKYEDHFKFVFVRNPWDRLVSCHSEKLAREGAPGLNTRDARFYPGMPFAEFVEAVHATPDEEANAHFRSQHAAACDLEGRVMADFVGRFERLREDFRAVAEGIGAPGLVLPHRLKSAARKARPYADFYDGRLKKLVGERYERDVETFGYAF